MQLKAINNWRCIKPVQIHSPFTSAYWKSGNMAHIIGKDGRPATCSQKLLEEFAEVVHTLKFMAQLAYITRHNV